MTVLETLTVAERRIAEFVARGWTNAEVASALNLSSKTVEWTLTNVYRKLQVRSRTELALHFAQLPVPRVNPRDSPGVDARP
jgi:DNA-binding NarL/FixJ family response regulator